MPLRRSDSTHTTFSTYVVRKTKYQRHLGVLNVLLMLGSLSVLFSGLCLRLFYYMDQLGFIATAFKCVLRFFLFSILVTFFP